MVSYFFTDPKGTSVCQMNSIPQTDLEVAVINAVLEFYKPYLAKGGKRKLADAVTLELGSEDAQFTQARERAEAEQNRITEIINNLLDNITSANRKFVDGRLKELSTQREQLESRLDELDRLVTNQTEINATVTDALQFLSTLKFTLRESLPQEKLAALRQCVERIHIGGATTRVTITLRVVPSSGVTTVQTLEVLLTPHKNASSAKTRSNDQLSASIPPASIRKHPS